MVEMTELRAEATIASPPEIIRDAASGDPLVRCRVSVPLPPGGDPNDREASKLPTAALSITVVANHWQASYELSRCALGDGVFIGGELRRHPRTGRLELWADLIHRHATPGEVEAAHG